MLGSRWLVASWIVLATGCVPDVDADPKRDCAETERDERGNCPAMTTAPKIKPAPRCPAEMVKVAPGSFTLGSAQGAGGADELAHQVTLAGYCLDRTEVTVAAYAACVAVKKCAAATEPAAKGWNSLCNGSRADRGSHPINCVGWSQAKTYCTWAKKRLPTEAEWEHAARGDDARTYPWGSEPPSKKRLNACGSECVRLLKQLVDLDWEPIHAEDDDWGSTSPVGSFPDGASPFGAMDLAGNVWEWTADLYGVYREGARNPTGATSGKTRVLRGGSWFDNDPSDVRAARRRSYEPTAHDFAMGFRCAR